MHFQLCIQFIRFIYLLLVELNRRLSYLQPLLPILTTLALPLVPDSLYLCP